MSDLTRERVKELLRLAEEELAKRLDHGAAAASEHIPSLCHALLEAWEQPQYKDEAMAARPVIDHFRRFLLGPPEIEAYAAARAANEGRE